MLFLFSLNAKTLINQKIVHLERQPEANGLLGRGTINHCSPLDLHAYESRCNSLQTNFIEDADKSYGVFKDLYCVSGSKNSYIFLLSNFQNEWFSDSRY